MKEGPPIRLRDDPSVARALRADLERSAAHPPGAYDVARGLGRFEQAVQAGAAGGAAGGTVLGAAFKGALVGVVFVGGAAVLELRTTAPESRPRVDTPSDRPAHAVAAPEDASAPEPPAAAVVQVPGSVASSVPVASDPKPPPPQAAAPEDRVAHMARGAADPLPVAREPLAAAEGTEDPLVAETRQLARLRSLAGTDPAQALALATEGGRRFPRGTFAQEREAIAIAMLVRLGRTGEARTRAEMFVAAYPRSAFNERVRTLTKIDTPQ
jgi:hypothetical protein